MKKTIVSVVILTGVLLLTACDSGVPEVPGIGNIDELGNSISQGVTDYVNNAVDDLVEEAKDKVREKVNETINDTIDDALGSVGLANPWQLTTNEALKETCGNSFKVPSNAKKTMFFYSPSLDTAQMQFEMDGVSYSARICNSKEDSDISGMYYTWDEENLGQNTEIMLYDLAGEIYYAEENGEVVFAAHWFDEENGKIYSVSGTGADKVVTFKPEDIFEESR